MARKLDLRSGHSVWTASRVPRVATRPLKRALTADVLVVGMGISGAMTAEALTSAGLSVVLIDRRGPLLGSTMATTALVQFEIDQPLTLLADKIGKAKAERAWRRSRIALANLAARIEDLEIRCDTVSTPSLFLAGNVLGPTALRQEAEARRVAGLQSTYLTASELSARFGIERDGAIVSYGNLALDPRKLTTALLNRSARRGARLYAPVEAVGFEESGESVRIFTREGPPIEAGFLVLATGYELMDGVPKTGHSIISTWAIATPPQHPLRHAALPLIWEASDPYLYVRATRDGRLICGGEDEDFTDTERRDTLIERKTERLSKKLKALLPYADVRAEFAWTGSFGSSATGLPLIGAVPGNTRVLAVMGYGGNGITYSQIASEIVRSAIEGRKDADADLYALRGRPR